MKKNLSGLLKSSHAAQFIRFCLVGASGVIVDTLVLHLLADSRWLHWNISLSKICSAETAMISNFFLNEFWTFRAQTGTPAEKEAGRLVRFFKFNGICSVGIVLSVLLLNLFYHFFHINLYLANCLAIGLVTVWNYGMNAKFNWGSQK